MFTIQKIKTLFLAFIFWLPLAILLSRVDDSEDKGIYTIHFLDMCLGILLWILCKYIASWFRNDKTL